MNKSWTLEEGIEVARLLEIHIRRQYNHYHTAIGGSVLHKGLSQKDLDIFIYPHKTSQHDRRYLEDKFREFGLVWKRDCDHNIYGDAKEVIECEYKGKRIDLFLLQ